jgi:hypothetical protein
LGIIGSRILRQRSKPRDEIETPHPNVAELPANSKRWPWGKAAELVGAKIWPKKTQPPGELHAEGRVEMEATSGPLSYPHELESGYWNPDAELPDDTSPPARGNTIERKQVATRTEIG